MSAGKVILLTLHIISAGAWISQFFVEVAIGRLARKVKGQPGAHLLAIAEGRAASMLGQIGGIGILITGFGLLGVDSYSFLGLTGYTPLWLMIKQVIYIIAMVIVFGVIIRGTRRFSAAVAAGEQPEIPVNVVMASRLVNVLVLVNIVLAVWKPL
jgi:hypothetical protein